MRHVATLSSSLLLLATVWDLALAQTAPTPNLPLTCPSASAINQPQNNCSGGLTYQLPSTDQLIVLRSPASAPIWQRAANLAGTDLIAVCALPVVPGTYSSCRDSAGVRRIVYVQKSQVFAAAPPPPPSSAARTLDLTRVPIEITEPGLYVLDRNWSVGPATEGVIVVTADNVTLDLQGFELSAEWAGINATGRNVTIRNGQVRSDGGTPIRVTGSNSRIERVQARNTYAGVIHLEGEGSTLTQSSAFNDEGGVGVFAGDGTIVRENTISSRFSEALIVSSRTEVIDNRLSSCGVGDPCVVIAGANNLFARNRIIPLSNVDAVVIRGNYNQAIDNLISSCSAARALVVEGQGNVIRDTLVPLCEPGRLEAGMVFTRDGNFYGDNTVWATVPFDVGATVQTDLGGNTGFVP